jgi:peptidyl-prolyl cis-trans isomerase B (cyclophilin B)
MIRGNKVVRLILIFTLIMGVSSLVVMLAGMMKERNSSYITIVPDEMELVQLEAPEEGASIAIVDTTLGEFRFVLYPEYSPDAVKNFTELAEQGYYDNTYVFHSESGVYSAAGAPNKDGSAKDNSHELVERELHQNLWPFKGAVLAMNTTVKQNLKEKVIGGGTYYNGGRFMLVNTVAFDEAFKEELLSYSESKELAEAFIEKGGVPNFSQQMTVIGQTYSGIEVVEKLASLETNNIGNYKFPAEDVMINSVKISTYSSAEETSEAEK